MMAMEQQRRAWARRGCEVRSPQIWGPSARAHRSHCWLAAVSRGLQMIVFLERNGGREIVQWTPQCKKRNHVDENEDGLELGHLRDRRTLGCRRNLPGNSRRAEASEKSHRGSDATEAKSGRARRSAPDRRREGRTRLTCAGHCIPGTGGVVPSTGGFVPSTSACVSSTSGWIQPGREAPRAAVNRGSGADNARRKQDVRRKPTERPGGVASSGLLPGTCRWSFRATDACCHSPFSEQHWRQAHRLLDCIGGQSVGECVLNEALNFFDVRTFRNCFWSLK